MVYIGAIKGERKKSYYNHRLSMDNAKYKNTKTFAAYFWRVKDVGKPGPAIVWGSVERLFDRKGDICNLCL